MSLSFHEIESNILNIKKEMESYPSSKLMAVIKTRTNEELAPVINVNLIDYVGENHAQEFLYHQNVISNIKTDFIGKLQTNKIKYIIGKVNLIQSLDSIHLADELNKKSEKLGIITNTLIEVNIAEEESKSGIMPEEFELLLEHVSSLKSIRVCGLMTISENTNDSKTMIKYFSSLRKMRDKYYPHFQGYENHPILSMGMTNSYKEALSEGSDIIRIGTGIFGERKYTNV